MVCKPRDLQVNEVPGSYHQLRGHRAFTSAVTQGSRMWRWTRQVAGAPGMSSPPSRRSAGSITIWEESEAA